MTKKNSDVIPGNSSFFPVSIDPALCNGCNRCVEVCQVDVFAPNPEPGKPPLILFAPECWQEGSCVAVCPQKGAMRWKRLLVHRVRCRHKDTAEDFFI